MADMYGKKVQSSSCFSSLVGREIEIKIDQPVKRREPKKKEEEKSAIKIIDKAQRVVKVQRVRFSKP